MTDIVERLRHWALFPSQQPHPAEICNEAADEIERLRKAYPFHSWNKERAILEAEIERLRAARREALEEAARVAEAAPFDPTIQPAGYNANVAGIAAAIRALKE